MMRGSILLLICLCFASASGSRESTGVEERQGRISAISRQASLQPAVKTDFPLEWIFSVRTTEEFNEWTNDDALPAQKIDLWRRLVAQASNLDQSQVEVISNWRRRSADDGGQRRRSTDIDAVIYCKTRAQRIAAITRIERNGDKNLERIIDEKYGPILRDIRTEYVGNFGGPQDADLAAVSEPASEPASSSGSGDVNPAVYASLAALIIPVGAGIYCLSKQNAKTQQQLQEVVANTRPSATAPPAPNPTAPTFPRDLTNAQNFPTNPYAVQPSAPTALPGMFR